MAITLEDFLADLGHQVFVLNMVNGLLERLEKDDSPPDLIIADLQPENTVRVCKIMEVHKRYPNVPIIDMINRR